MYGKAERSHNTFEQSTNRVKDMTGEHKDIPMPLGGIPAGLHSIFLPQLRQFDAQNIPVPFGVAASLDNAMATGWFWTYPVDEDCLVTTMHLVAHRSFVLHEEPEVDYRVLGLLSSFDTGLVNDMWHVRTGASPGSPFEKGFFATLPRNVLAFSMLRGPREFEMAAGSLHDSCNICMLPSFLARIGSLLGKGAPDLRDAFDQGISLNDSPRLLQTMHGIDPRGATRAGAPLHYRALVFEALAEMASCLQEAKGAASPVRLASGGNIAEAVNAALIESLANPPSLDELAERLYLSRTRLCQRFKDETGTSVGARLADLRIEEAKRRLVQADQSITAVAHAVGYAHTSSFSSMFTRHEGMSPSDWRNKHASE